MFRQAQFAEFELRMHEMAAKGQPITGEAMAKLYLDITRKYYGHEQKVAIVERGGQRRARPYIASQLRRLDRSSR